MPVIALIAAAFVIGFEKLVEWKYGPAGILGLLILSIGIKARNPTCISVGAVVLVMAVAGTSQADVHF